MGDQDPQSGRAKKKAPALPDERSWLVTSLQCFYLCEDKRPLETMLNEKRRAGNNTEFNSALDTEKQRRACLCTRQVVEISHKDRRKWTGSTERGGGIHDKIRRSVVDLMDRYVL